MPRFKTSDPGTLQGTGQRDLSEGLKGGRGCTKTYYFFEIFQKNPYVSVHYENYCVVPVELKNGI